MGMLMVPPRIQLLPPFAMLSLDLSLDTCSISLSGLKWASVGEGGGEKSSTAEKRLANLVAVLHI